MNKKKTSFLCTIIFWMLLLNIATIQVYASPDPTVSVYPDRITFTTEDTSVGDSFTVEVNVADIVDPGLYAYEFKLYYDNTLLEATAWSLPEGHFLTPAEGEMALYQVPASGIYHEDGYVLVAISSQGDVIEPKVGAGVLATITFEITAAPPPDGEVSCDLELRDLVFADPEITPISMIAEHGLYEFTTPKPLLYLSVEPSKVGAIEVGDQVTIDIMINDVEEEYLLTHVQWKLFFNETLLRATVLVQEGDFIKSFGETFFWWIEETDIMTGEHYIQSFTQLNPPHTEYPDGSGILATIVFEALYKNESGKVSTKLEFDVEWCNWLSDMTTLNSFYDLVDGEYVIPVKPGDLNFDDKVDILDIAIFGQAYGSYLGHPRWNALADVVRDKVINILDVITIAKNFGT